MGKTMSKGSILGQEFSKKLDKLLKAIPLHPRIITLLSLVLAIAGYVVFDYSGWEAFGLFIAALIFGALDGPMAAAKSMESRKANFVEGISDRIVEFLMLLAMLRLSIPAFFMSGEQMVVGVLFFGTCMGDFLKAYAEHTQAIHHARAARMPGMMERAERVVLICAVFALALAGNGYAAPVLLFTVAISFATAGERMVRALLSKE